MIAVASAVSMQDMAEQVNSMQTSWTAKAPVDRFGSFDDVKVLLGAKLKTDADYVEVLSARPAFLQTFTGDIPTDWDVRTAFPDCSDVTGHIGDQSSCGSCWAFGSTMAFNDRHCIATGDHTFLSTEDTTANCGFLHCLSMGCNGGHPGAAWQWFASSGVVTGGGYEMTGQGATCAPYSLAPCAHHVPATEKYPACPSDEYPTPSLSQCSESAYAKDYKSDKIQAASSYDMSCGALSQSGCLEKIQRDMIQYGSATVAFTVYEDFPTYKSGVYKHVSGSQLGGHAVRLIGWGVENGEDYWLVANSWNEQWGDNGTFKIARGTNECGIEGNVQAGTASASTVV